MLRVAPRNIQPGKFCQIQMSSNLLHRLGDRIPPPTICPIGWMVSGRILIFEDSLEFFASRSERFFSYLSFKASLPSESLFFCCSRNGGANPLHFFGDFGRYGCRPQWDVSLIPLFL